MMKKLILGSMIAVAAVFAAPVFAQKAPAVPANTASLLKLIPADSHAALSVNSSALLNSKLLNNLAKTYAGKDINQLLQDAGMTASDQNNVSVMAIKLLDINTGKCELTGASKYYKNNAGKNFDAAVKNAKEEIAKNPQLKGIVLNEITVVEGQKAFVINGASQGVKFSVLTILASPDTIQYRIGVGEGVVPEKKLIPALGAPCKLAQTLNMRSVFSVSVDMENVKKLMPAEAVQNNPMLAGLSFIALAIRETKDSIKAKMDITGTVDSAPMYQMQAAQMLEMLKQDPNNKTLADGISLKLNANVLTIQAAFPSELIMKKIAEAQQKAAAQKQAAPAAAPAPAPASAK